MIQISSKNQKINYLEWIVPHLLPLGGVQLFQNQQLQRVPKTSSAHLHRQIRYLDWLIPTSPSLRVPFSLCLPSKSSLHLFDHGQCVTNGEGNNMIIDDDSFSDQTPTDMTTVSTFNDVELLMIQEGNLLSSSSPPSFPISSDNDGFSDAMENSDSSCPKFSSISAPEEEDALLDQQLFFSNSNWDYSTPAISLSHKRSQTTSGQMVLLRNPFLSHIQSSPLQSTFGITKDDLDNLAKLNESDFDLDYFAIDLPISSSLHLLEYFACGPFLTLVSFVDLKKIQDPVVQSWKFINVLSFNPILAFEDLSESFPLRKKFVSYLNQKVVLFLDESPSKKSGAMLSRVHDFLIYDVLCGLNNIGVNVLRMSKYGTKLSVSKLEKCPILVSLFSKCEPQRSFFDVAISVSHEKLYGVKFDSIPSCLSSLKLYPYFGYLFDGTAGGFSFQTQTDGSKIFFKWYSLVYHHLLSKSSIQWRVPKYKRDLQRQLDSIQNLFQKLKNEENSLGGYRIEIRFYHKGFWKCLHDFASWKLYSQNHLKEWIMNLIEEEYISYSGPCELKFTKVSRFQYLQYLEAMLALSFHNPDPKGVYGGGLFYGDTSKQLDETERKMVETLFNSFGYYTDRLRRLDFKNGIEDWVGFDQVCPNRNLSNLQLILQAREKLFQLNTSPSEDSESLSEIDRIVYLDILKNVRVFHPKNNSLYFKTHCKQSHGTTKAFETKELLALHIISLMRQKLKQNPRTWRQYFSHK